MSSPFTSAASARRRRQQHRRAYTLLEAALVLFAMTTFAAIGVLAFGGSNVHVSDRTAQAAADAVVTAAADHAATAGVPPSSPAAFDAVVPDGITVTVGEADGPSEVSYAATGTEVAAAAWASDGSCWLAYMALEAPAGDYQRAYALIPASSTLECTGDNALDTVEYRSDARGGTWSSPVRR